MRESQKLKEFVISSIRYLDDLSIDNIIDYIDYVNKVRYTSEEIIEVLLRIVKEEV